MKKLANLQGARGIAVLFVVAFHLAEAEIAYSAASVRGWHWFHFFGFAGVDLFFVISGFIITWVSYDSFGRKNAVPSYILRRLVRIYPTYWCCFLAVLATCVFKFNQALSQPGYGTIEIIKSAFLVPQRANHLVPVAWSLVHELWFYAIVGLFLLASRSAFRLWLMGWFMLVVVACSTSHPSLQKPDGIAYYLFSPFNIDFILGCGLAFRLRRNGRPWRPYLAAVAGTVLFGVAGSIDYFFDGADLAHHLGFRVLFFGPASALLVYGLVGLEIERGWKLPNWLLRIGNASYSIYLWHLLVFAIFRGWLRMLEARDATGHLATYWIMGGAAIATGVATFEWVESPLIEWLSRRIPRPRVSQERLVELASEAVPSATTDQ